MGYLEAVVVVYIRKILSIGGVVDLTQMVMSQVPQDVMRLEISREAATIIMIIAVALLVEKGKRYRLSVFLWVFAMWDIFYYVSLKILIDWPKSLGTVDCLFLIPGPWIAPVWIPFLAMAMFLTAAIWLARKNPVAK